MNPIRTETDAAGIVTITFDDPAGPVNTMSLAWQESLTAIVDKLAADAANIKGVLLASAKSTFFAGAELKGVLKLTAADAPRVYQEVETVKRNFRRLETLGKPVVSLINGTALGGGFELALVGHYRIALDNPKTQLGLPEVTLGLLPGATGVTKMVRLLGLEAAFPFLMEGKTFGVAQALDMGLVHAIAATPEDMLAQGRAWIAANPAPKQPWDEKGYRIPGGGPSNPKIAQMLAIAPAMIIEKTRGLLPAPQAILSCAVEGAQVDFDTALRIESRYLSQLMVSQVTKNLITIFFNQGAIKSAQFRPKTEGKTKAVRVGILGAGMMGGGIAWANANRGVPCVLRDMTQEKADKGRAYSEALLAKRVKQGRMDEARAAHTLSLIQATDNVANLKGCDLIIEAVFEKRDLKAQVTREAEPMLAENGVFASNTSTLPISGLAQASAKPENFVGLHFFSPVDKMALVEIIKGEKTSAQTLARAYDYVQQIGKTPIVVNDSRGFYTSRTFGTYVREGACMVEEGIPAAVIENAARQCGMPVGPLAVIDETSMSLSVHVMEQTRADLGKNYVEQPGERLFERMVKEFGRPGRAGGGGFYDYPEKGAKKLWGGLKPFEKSASFDLEELKRRFLYRQAIETIRCMEEGVLTSVAEANIGSIFGIGFPPWTGGALQYVAAEGEHFIENARALERKYGARFALSEAAIAKVKNGFA